MNPLYNYVSKSTASHDYITKLAVYQKFGVLESNIVEQSVHIIQYALEDEMFLIKNTFKGDDTFVSAVFPEFKVNLDNIF